MEDARRDRPILAEIARMHTPELRRQPHGIDLVAR
jgi:hypothetical protein